MSVKELTFTRKPRLFISQPMKGKTPVQIRQERDLLVQQAEALGYEVINSVLNLAVPPGANQSVWYLGGSLQALATADVLLCMEGWDKANGCKFEHDVAAAYGIKVILGLEEQPE